MDYTTLEIKRKNIDLPVETLRKLSILAANKGQSLKAFIQDFLIAKADTVELEVRESPSPSYDAWFDNAHNVAEAKKGVAQLSRGEGKEYTLDELKSRMGI